MHCRLTTHSKLIAGVTLGLMLLAGATADPPDRPGDGDLDPPETPNLTGGGEEGGDGEGGGSSPLPPTLWKLNGSNIFYRAGNVGIGVGSPRYPLDVRDDQRRTIFAVNQRETGSAYAVWGQANGTKGRGLFGWARAATGSTIGAWGRSDSIDGTGVLGEATAATGETAGVLGRADSVDGTGVFGEGSAATGATTGVWGRTSSNGGIGVYGESTITSGNGGIGVLGTTGSTSGTGVRGVSTAAGGSFGVHGQSNGVASIAIRGSHVGATGSGWGVLGSTQSDEGTAGAFSANTAGGLALLANNAADVGDIIMATNGADTEFRVDSTGDVFCDLAFNGGGADYAEWLQRLDPDEHLSPGDVVGIFAGQVSRQTAGAQQMMVISTNPVLVGNNANAEDSTRDGFERVAFIGQTPVSVRGVVNIGDFIVASGDGDGVAVAVSRDSLSPIELSRIVGTAWEASVDVGVTKINCAIGIDQMAVTAAVANYTRLQLASRDRKIDTLTDRLGQLEAMVAQLVIYEER